MPRRLKLIWFITDVSVYYVFYSTSNITNLQRCCLIVQQSYMALYFKDAMMDEELKEQDTSAHLQRMKKNLCSGMKD